MNLLWMNSSCFCVSFLEKQYMTLTILVFWYYLPYYLHGVRKSRRYHSLLILVKYAKPEIQVYFFN